MYVYFSDLKSITYSCKLQKLQKIYEVEEKEYKGE